MKKTALLFLTTLLLLMSIQLASGQEADDSLIQRFAEQEIQEAAEEKPPLAQRFPNTKILDRFNNIVPVSYYRFSPDVLFFEPIDLSYFPHESWSKNQWVLLGRWTDGNTYNQMIYSDQPADRMMMHGTDTGESRGIMRDFYLYATLFIEDNYPQDTGSCYVYYSDSLMIGLKQSKGILIDPETGIYEATNEYGGSRHTTYTPNTIKHNLEMIQELDPADYRITRDEIEGSSIGNAEFPQLAFDDNFSRDWDVLTSAFRMSASPEIKAYRVEVIRENGVSTIYINGKEVYSASDNLRTLGEDGNMISERVSWSYGPILNTEGLTVTCAVGDFGIFSGNL